MDEAYFDLGRYGRSVTTGSEAAQVWFDRGLGWTYGYNHEEAVACYRRALDHDPDCATAHWGVAYAAGPNYNMPWWEFDEAGRAEALATAFDASRAALARADRVSAPEAALIRALPARYPQRALADLDQMRRWNDDFADAMRAVHAAHPRDPEVVAIFAEAIMNRTPWKMWDLATGGPAADAGTAEAMAVLDAAFRDIPGAWSHPGLLHLWIHLLEMSPFPERALRQADALRELCPDAGHLIHMPTHIDVLCGNYADVVMWNRRAIAADDRFAAREGVMNIYTAYRIHNHHFAIYGAMFLGQKTAALKAADQLIAAVPDALLRIASPPMADYMEGYLQMKSHVQVRFGMWHEILAEDLPEDPDLYCSVAAMQLYAKAVARSALGDVAEAEAAREAFHAAKAAVPETRRVHNNRVVDLLEIASAMLDGELEYRKGNHDVAFAHLRRSVALDDALPYDEPWGWMQPTRHALGALLLEQGRMDEAEAVYRADLGLDDSLARSSRHPANVWSLHGLHECLTRRGETVEARHVKLQLDQALARSEVPVHASCFCRRTVA